jgi:hypothetical protein
MKEKMNLADEPKAEYSSSDDEDSDRVEETQAKANNDDLRASSAGS